MNIGFKAMYRCAMMGVASIMVPGILLTSIVGSQYAVFILLALLITALLGMIMGMSYEREISTPKRDEKGRFVKQ